MKIIEVDSVSKSFSIPSVRRDTVREHALDLFRPRPVERIRVLDSVSFSVAPGETLGIMGRNGCGKSTLLRILSGIYQADAGMVTVRAPVTPILELGVGWDPELTAIDNIYLLGSVMGLSLREIRQSIDEILAFAELERFANLELRHYSSGMSSRLAYAVAFKAVREILILDEIFAVGDASFNRRCQEHYRELSAKGHTVIMVSHDHRLVSRFCNRAILLEGGRVIMDDTGVTVAQAYVNLLAGQASAPATVE
jgi:ABC-type polysaccharide/polyol phosphate transport system ATPase subunit